MISYALEQETFEFVMLSYLYKIVTYIVQESGDYRKKSNQVQKQKIDIVLEYIDNHFT